MNANGSKNLGIGDGFRFGIGLWLSSLLIHGVLFIVGAALVGVMFGSTIRSVMGAVEARVQQRAAPEANGGWYVP